MQKLYAIMIAALCAFGVHAEVTDTYLYWMLDPVTDSRLEFAYAQLAYEYTDSAGNVKKEYAPISVALGEAGDDWVGGGGEEWGHSRDLGSGLGPGGAAAFYSLLPSVNTAGMTFFVELYNELDGVVGVTQYLAYEEIRDEWKYSDMSTSGTVSPYHFSASVPEPSCGLLMLFGLGMLGLKRKRRGREVEV